jgi:hypothetical protein
MANSLQTTQTITVGDVVLDIKFPSGKVFEEAKLHRAAAWRKAAAAGAILQDNLPEFLRSIGAWDDKKENRKKELFEKMYEKKKKLKKGGIKKSEGREIALEIAKLHNETMELLAEYHSHAQQTAESISEDFWFNYLVSACTVYNLTGERYFRDLDDYLERISEPESIAAATKLATMIYKGFEENVDDSRDEIKFLKKYHFMDEKGNLLNKEGKRVSLDGKLINEEGQFIDEKGNRVDIFGSPVIDEEGIFLDDEEEVKDS